MTETLQSPKPALDTVDPAETTAQPRVAAFKFPFAATNFAPKQAAAQPWHQKGNTARHEKKIGMAPKGTRRSMGKR